MCEATGMNVDAGLSEAGRKGSGDPVKNHPMAPNFEPTKNRLIFRRKASVQNQGNRLVGALKSSQGHF
jgi:hypothetical protein